MRRNHVLVTPSDNPAVPVAEIKTLVRLFISVFNQLEVQNLFYNKFISCLYMFRAHVFETCRAMK